MKEKLFNCCDIIKKEMVTYHLHLEFVRSFNINNKEIKSFKLFYKPIFYCSFQENPRIIGVDTGQGKENIEELVNELVELLK